MFLKNLHKELLDEDGKIFLSLVRGKATDESWNFLIKDSEWHNRKDLHILISKNKLVNLL
jgi:hypothetical protein